MSAVILRYKRVDGDKSTGQIAVRGGDNVETEVHDFSSWEFKEMLTRFAGVLIAFPDAAGVLQRTDRDGLVPYTLDPRTVDLFRTDPVAAVASMSVPYGSPSSTVKRVRDERSLPSSSELRVGYAVLADSFGDELYARFDGERLKVECPCCGIWANTVGKHFTMACINPGCAAIGHQEEFHSPTEKWATFETPKLLALDSPRYYFPRAWNLGSWISWADLNAKYEQYKKEKASCP